MNTLENLQKDFLYAIYGAPNLGGLKAGFEPNLEIYRNNLKFGALENLRGKFPICETMLGEDFFRNAVFELIEFAPIKLGHNNEFGDEFAQFLNGFLESDFRFVAKIAEIEWAKFCAETALNVENADFASVSNAIAAGGIQFELHPSFSIIDADFNAFEIYFAHENQNPDSVQLIWKNQTIAIWRDRDFDPCFKILDDFEITFLRAIIAQKNILEAIEISIKAHGQTEENQTKFVTLCNSGVLKI